MKGFKATLTALAFTMMLTAPAMANDLPGKGVTVNPARATWNTGFFQEALVRRGLETLGYKVKKPKDLANPIFYKSLVLGDVDYWCNGWFPNHDSQLPKNFAEKADKYGYVVKAGGLQGYLVSKKDADKYNIQSLDDFKRDEVKKAFDKNNDGKADLTACPPAGVVKMSLRITWMFMTWMHISIRSRPPMRLVWLLLWLVTRVVNLSSFTPGHQTGQFSN